MADVPESSSRSRKVFREYYGILEGSINSAENLAGLLYSDHLISAETRSEINSTSSASPIGKSACVLDAVEKTLVASQQPELVFSRLCNVLELSGEPALQEIARRMQSSVRGKCPNRAYSYFHFVPWFHINR